MDIAIETEERLVPVEVKLSATPRPAMASVIESFRRDLGAKTAPGYVIHPGETRSPLGKDLTALLLADL